MLERLIPSSPEIPAHQLLHTLIILGATQNSSGQDPVLDRGARIAALAAGLLVMAGLAKKIALVSANDSGNNLMKNYLGNIDIPKGSISFEKLAKDTDDEAKQIKELVKSHSNEDVGIITTHSTHAKVAEGLDGIGLKLQQISPEEEIGARIADSAQKSRQIITELLKESLLNLVRFQKMLEEVRITRLTLPNTKH